jgi:TrmH family RNA methyltransferase
MLSKSQISLLKSLQHKKFRLQHGVFLVEGYKSIIEFVLCGHQIKALYYTPAIAPKLLNLSQKINLNQISPAELEKISGLKTPQDILAVVKIPDLAALEEKSLKNKFTLVLDGIQDPGNMGTIIRTADWFGITSIICAEDTVDAYNPKVVQATMGSLARINIYYAELEKVLPLLNLPVYGALLNGENIYTTDFGSEGLIVMGNEGSGLRDSVQQLVNKAVTIPRAGQAESLNVAIATAVFCSEACRKTLK